MFVKFNLDMFCDPDPSEPNPTHLTHERSARFRSANLTAKQAEAMFNRIAAYLEKTLEKTYGKNY